MKTLEMNEMGLFELSTEEMIQTDGGFLPLIAAAAVLLLASSCTINNNYIEGDNNHVNTSQSTSADSTANGNSAGTGTGNSVNR